MKRNFADRFWDLCSADFLSAKDFVRHAVLVLLVFIVAHLFGLREYTSVLNGTTGGMNVNPDTAAMLGLVYVLLYLATVLGVPILILAAAISMALQRLFLKPNLNE